MALAARSRRAARLVLADSAGIPVADAMSWKRRFTFYIAKTVHNLILYKDPLVMGRIAKDFLSFRMRRFWRWKRVLKAGAGFAASPFTDFSELRMPVAIFWGTGDEIFPPSHAKKLHSAIPGSALLWIRGNHDWPLFKPGMFAGTIGEWLAGTGY